MRNVTKIKADSVRETSARRQAGDDQTYSIDQAPSVLPDIDKLIDCLGKVR
jgi:hypothetical protein